MVELVLTADEASGSGAFLVEPLPLNLQPLGQFIQLDLFRVLQKFKQCKHIGLGLADATPKQLSELNAGCLIVGLDHLESFGLQLGLDCYLQLHEGLVVGTKELLN